MPSSDAHSGVLHDCRSMWRHWWWILIRVCPDSASHLHTDTHSHTHTHKKQWPCFKRKCKSGCSKLTPPTSTNTLPLNTQTHTHIHTHHLCLSRTCRPRQYMQYSTVEEQQWTTLTVLLMNNLVQCVVFSTLFPSCVFSPLVCQSLTSHNCNWTKN